MSAGTRVEYELIRGGGLTWKRKYILISRTKINKNHSAMLQPRRVVVTSAPTHVPTYRKMIFLMGYELKNMKSDKSELIQVILETSFVEINYLF